MSNEVVASNECQSTVDTSSLERLLRLSLVLCGAPAVKADTLDLAAARKLEGLVHFERCIPSFSPIRQSFATLESVTVDEAIAEYERLRQLTAGSEGMTFQWLSRKLVNVFCSSDSGMPAVTRGAVYSGLRLFAKYVAMSAIAQRELKALPTGEEAKAAGDVMCQQSRRIIRFQSEAGQFGVDFIARQCVEICASIFDSACPRTCPQPDYNDRFILHKNHVCALFKFDVVEQSPLDFFQPMEPLMQFCHPNLLPDVIHIVNQLVLWPEFSLCYANYASLVAFAAIYFSAKRFLPINVKMPVLLADVATVCPRAAAFTELILAAEGQ